MLDKGQRAIKMIVDEFKRLGVKKVGPSHCAGQAAMRIFKEKYGDDFIEVKVGQIMEV